MLSLSLILSTGRIPAARRLGALVATVLLPAVAGAQTPGKIGSEFSVNTYTTGWQGKPSVASTPLGNFVVIWHSEGSFSNDQGSSINGQILGLPGNRIGPEFQVNTYTTSWQLWPAVAMNSSEEFVVVWSSLGSYGSDRDWFSIQGRHHDSDGAPFDNQFQISTYTTSWQLLPEITSDAAGNFVVTWDSFGSDGSDTSGYSVQAQRFDPIMQPVGGEFQVNTYTTRRQYYPAISSDTRGNFIIVWESQGSSGSDRDGSSIQAQRFSANGVKLGGEFQVNTYTRGLQRKPAVASTKFGDFTVVWESNGLSSPQNEAYVIQGQAFASDGSRIGAQFQVNNVTTKMSRWPAITSVAPNGFVVSWSRYEYATPVPDSEILSQRFAVDGSKIGSEAQTSSTVDGFKREVSVAAQSGGFVVAWRSDYEFGTLVSEIKGQRMSFSALTSVVFQDGFESGNSSAWTSVSP